MGTIHNTTEIKEGITRELYEKINKLANLLNMKFTKCKSQLFGRYYIYNLGETIVNSMTKDESTLYKDMLLTSIIFPDNEKFGKSLIHEGLTLKMLHILQNENSKKREILLEQIEKYAERNCGTIQAKNAVLNKINQILVFNPEYLVPEKELTILNKKTKELTEKLKNNSNVEFIYYNIVRNNEKILFEYNVVLSATNESIAPTMSEIANLIEEFILGTNRLENISVDVSVVEKNKFIKTLNQEPQTTCDKILKSKILYSKNSDLVGYISDVIQTTSKRNNNNLYVNAVTYSLNKK